MTACTGVILAGGQALRFGGLPKGLERVGGMRIIDRVAAALRVATDELLLIANDPLAAEWLPGVRIEADLLAGAGSLGGIHAALVHAGGPVVVVAWDMPFVPSSLLVSLRRAGEAGGAGAAEGEDGGGGTEGVDGPADAVVPESDSKRGLEPLCAYYSPACIAPIERRLAADDRRVIGFYEDVRMARLPQADVARHGDPAAIFMNINTPADLTRAEQHVRATDGGRHRQEA